MRAAQVDQPIPSQTGVETFALPQGSAAALAAVTEETPEPSKDRPVEIAKRSARIPVSSVLGPAGEAATVSRSLLHQLLQEDTDA